MTKEMYIIPEISEMEMEETEFLCQSAPSAGIDDLTDGGEIEW